MSSAYRRFIGLAVALTMVLVVDALAVASTASARPTRVSRVAVWRPSARPYALGMDEGVGTTNADAWQASGLTGAGVRVAVIDLGFAGLRDAKARGSIRHPQPPSTSART
jgi:hypothetical protein